MSQDITEILISKHPNLLSTIQLVRRELEYRYGVGQNLRGRGEEASLLLVHELRRIRYNAHVMRGYCWTDLEISERYREHSWIQVYGIHTINIVLYIDITAEQFNEFTSQRFPSIYVGRIPKFMRRGKPNKPYIKNKNRV